MAEIKNYKPKINLRNKNFLKQILDMGNQYKIIGVVDVGGLPAPQFQRIRASLSKTAKVLILKKNIVKLALTELEKTHSGISQLANKMSGIVGLVFTNDNPFTMYKFVKKNKSTAPAKAGQIAPNDIVVSAGPTSFAPGPIIGELGALGIKAGINAGKVEIKEDSVVAKEGDEITGVLAGVLTTLGVEPMEVGLNIKAIYEDKTIYDRDVLDVDEDAILADLKNEVARSAKLAIGLEYYTSENINHFIGQASRDSLSLGVGVAWPAAETINKLVQKANSQMVGVANSLPEDLRPAGVAVVSTVSAPVTEEVSTSAVNEEPKKEEEPAADAAAGLGNLF